MINLHRLSIRQKFMLAIMAATNVVLIVAGAGLLIEQYYSEKSLLVESALEMTQIAALNSAPAVLFWDEETGMESLDALMERKSMFSAAILDVNGEIFVKRGKFIDDLANHVVKNCEPWVFKDDHLDLCEPLVLNEEEVGRLYLEMDLSDLSRRQWPLIKNLLIILLLSFIFSYWLAARFSLIISKPVLKLARNIKQVGDASDLTSKVDIQSQDEVGELASAFNNMLDRLHQDIEVRRGMENKIARMLQEHETIMSAIPDVAYQLDNEGRLVWWNDTLEQVTGLDSDQLLNVTASDLFVDEDKKRMASAILAAITQGYAEEEGRLLTLTGSTEYQFNGAGIVNDQGEVIGITGIGRDVSAQRQAESMLKRIADGTSYAIGADYLQQLVKSLADELGVACVFVAKTDINVAGDEGYEITAIWKDERIGDVMQCFEEGLCDLPLNDDLILCCPEGGQNKFQGNSLFENTGAESIIGMSLNARNDKRIGVLIILDNKPIQDVELAKNIITLFAARAGAELERLHSEQALLQFRQQLQQAQKMESLGKLTGGIAHDFNNMLASILGYADLSRRLIQCDDTGKLEQYLDHISTAGLRARDLIAQMLTFSRTSRENDSAQELSLAPLVQEVTEMLRPVLPSSIAITEYFDRNLPPVLAKPIMMHQVLMNMIVNARDAMNGEGQIDISLKVKNLKGARCSSCHHDIDEAVQYIEIAIADTGSGIDQTILDNIFDPFFTTKEVGKGTGMGLSMVHGIIHEYSGHIVVESPDTGGSCFNLYLPVVESAAEEQAESSSKVTGNDEGNGQHILVVDDEDEVAGLMSEILSTAGYQVTTYNDSLEALEYFSQHADGINFVVTDQTMPGLTGIQMAQEIFKIRPKMPMALCTGYSDQVDEESASALGIRAFFMKPVPVTELLRVISECLS